MTRRRLAAASLLTGGTMALLTDGSLAYRGGVGVGWMFVPLLIVASARLGRSVVARLRRKLARLDCDERALSSAFLGFFLIIIVGALVYTLLDPAMSTIVSTSLDQAESTQAINAIDRREEIWINMLYFMLFLASIFIVGNAVFESRRPG